MVHSPSTGFQRRSDIAVVRLRRPRLGLARHVAQAAAVRLRLDLDTQSSLGGEPLGVPGRRARRRYDRGARRRGLILAQGRPAPSASTSRAPRSPIATGSPSPVSQLPIPTAIAPAAMNDGPVSIVTPPVGISGISGNGPRISRTKPGPTTETGKSFTADAPERHARRASVGVDAPGNAGMPRSSAASM